MQNNTVGSFKYYALSVVLLAIALLLSLGVWSSLASRPHGTLVPTFPYGACVPAKMAGPWQEGILTVDLKHHAVCYVQGNDSWCNPLCQ